MSNAEKADLLPCPFCGKGQEHFHRYSRKIGFDFFYCIRCYCCAEAIGQTEQEVEQLWNTRVQPTQQHQGEPVAKLGDGELISMANKAAPHADRDNDMFYIAMGRLVEERYTHADPAEVERLRAEVAKLQGCCVDLDSEKREIEHKMDAYKGAAWQRDFCAHMR